VMSSREFAEWQAYDRIDPFGEERGDLRNAILCQFIDGKLRTKGQPPPLDDFMPKFDKPREEQTAGQVWQTLKNWAHQINALHASGARPR
jgi:hypothetical protein